MAVQIASIASRSTGILAGNGGDRCGSKQILTAWAAMGWPDRLAFLQQKQQEQQAPQLYEDLDAELRNLNNPTRSAASGSGGGGGKSDIFLADAATATARGACETCAASPAVIHADKDICVQELT